MSNRHKSAPRKQQETQDTPHQLARKLLLHYANVVSTGMTAEQKEDLLIDLRRAVSTVKPELSEQQLKAGFIRKTA